MKTHSVRASISGNLLSSMICEIGAIESRNRSGEHYFSSDQRSSNVLKGLLFGTLNTRVLPIECTDREEGEGFASSWGRSTNGTETTLNLTSFFALPQDQLDVDNLPLHSSTPKEGLGADENDNSEAENALLEGVLSDKGRRRILGVLSVRRDGFDNPSFADCHLAARIKTHKIISFLSASTSSPSSSSSVGFEDIAIVLVLNVPCTGGEGVIPSWTFDVQYTCYIVEGLDRSPRAIPLTVPSLPPGDGKTRNDSSRYVLHRMSVLGEEKEAKLRESIGVDDPCRVGGGYNRRVWTTDGLLRSRATAEVCGAVETVLLASSILRDIESEGSELASLEEEVKELQRELDELERTEGDSQDLGFINI